MHHKSLLGRKYLHIRHKWASSKQDRQEGEGEGEGRQAHSLGVDKEDRQGWEGEGSWLAGASFCV